jgi:Aspartyl/Asparaginyl beta-hydroxylase
VGNESRPWREGELMLFDDSMEHEAWNNSGELRAVLLFDVWRPELSQMERGLVSTMLASIRQAGGVAPASDQSDRPGRQAAGFARIFSATPALSLDFPPRPSRFCLCREPIPHPPVWPSGIWGLKTL